MNPKISVIIPVYNVEKYLEKCLLSILNQTFDSLEIIVINDGSTDGSADILKQFSVKDKRLKVINQTNKGVSAARNKGLSLARGDYVSFIDSDDIISNDMFSIMYAHAFKKNADIVVCNWLRFNSDDELVLDKYCSDFRVCNYTNIEALKEYTNDNISGYLWDKIFKRTLLIENNIYCPDSSFAEDIYPVLKALDYANKIVKLEVPLYFYRCTPNSASDVKKISKLESNLIEHANQIKNCTTYLELKYSTILEKEILKFKLYRFINQLYFYNKITSLKFRSKKNLKFYLNDYYKDLSLKKVILARNISLDYKIRYILWKLGLYSLYLNMKKYLHKFNQ